MTSLDHWLTGLGRGGGTAIAFIAALLLGLRHATDPDHLTAVSALALSDDRRGARRAGILGLSWGLGHATTLMLFGVPALLLRRFIPDPAQHVAEALIGIVIMALAARLLLRWRRGYFTAIRIATASAGTPTRTSTRALTRRRPSIITVTASAARRSPPTASGCFTVSAVRPR